MLLSKRTLIAGIMCVGVLNSYSIIAHAGGKTRLTAQEVKQLFVGKQWDNPNGTFLFTNNGKYTYTEFSKTKPRGEWYYQIGSDGTLFSRKVNYTFYRLDDGSYVYYHSRSRKYFSAKP